MGLSKSRNVPAQECNDAHDNAPVPPPEPVPVPCSELCSQKWKDYVDKDYKLQDGWEIILDDTRGFEASYTMTSFLATCTDIFENLLLGSQDVISPHVHTTFTDVLIKRLESIIKLDYLNHKKKEFTPSIHFTRINDDRDKNRKQQLVFVMSLRITDNALRRGVEQELNTIETNVEMFLRIQIRSIKEIYNTTYTTANDGDFGSRQCGQNMNTDFSYLRQPTLRQHYS